MVNNILKVEYNGDSIVTRSDFNEEGINNFISSYVYIIRV